MEKININTDKLKNDANELMELSNTLNNNISNYFDRLSAMPEKTKEWVGNSSVAFANRMNIEKISYIEIKEYVVKYSKFMSNLAVNIDKAIKESEYNG